MEEYEKQIFVNDLCGRLGHDVVVRVGTTYDIANNITEDGTLKGIEFNDPYFGTKALVNIKTNSGSTTFGVAVEDVKPYLRPMSSMTSKEWVKFCDCSLKDETSWVIISNRQKFIPVQNRENYLNSKHFDYRGLIEKGLALEAPEGMYTVLCRNINAKTVIREKTPFFDKNGVRIYDGDVFVYLKYTNFEDGVPSDLIENYSKYKNEVMLHPVFWYDKEKSWCSDVYGDCDYMASYDFNEVVVVTNRGEHPELYNY